MTEKNRTTDKGKRYMGKEIFILNYDAPVADVPVQFPLGLAQFGLTATN